MDGLDIGALLSAPPATAFAVVLYFLGRDALKEWKRRRSDAEQKIRYGNGSVKDSEAWRGQTDARLAATDKRLTQLETKFDAWGVRFDAEMAAAKATRNKMFDTLQDIQQRLSHIEGWIEAREGK